MYNTFHCSITLEFRIHYSVLLMVLGTTFSVKMNWVRIKKVLFVGTSVLCRSAVAQCRARTYANTLVKPKT